MALVAATNSDMRSTGFDHGVEKRRSMLALTCVPRPSMKRPPDSFWRSQAV